MRVQSDPKKLCNGLLMPDEITPLIDSTDCTTDEYDIEKETSMYDDILSQSIRKVHIIILATLTVPFLGSTRYFILQIYMQSISSADTFVVSSIIFGGMFYYTLTSIFMTWSGDKVGHDKVLLVSFLIVAIGIFLECIATDLTVFTIGYFINKVPLQSVAMAYIAYLLPHRYAVKYTARLYMLCSIIYLFGPPIAGAIVYFFSYRVVFWVNFVFLSLCMLIAYAFLIGSQKKLQNIQSHLPLQFTLQQPYDDQFPICIEQYNNNYANDEDYTNDQDAQSLRCCTFSFHLPRHVTKYQMIMLALAIAQNALCWSMESILIFYYGMFVVNRFGDSSDDLIGSVGILYASGMLLLVTLSYAAIITVIPKMVSRIVPKYVYLITASSFLMTLTCLMCTLHTVNLIFFWIIAVVLGGLFGIISISTEMAVLEMQPKEHSGKVSGFKTSLTLLFKAVSILAVGTFWMAPYYNAIWFGMAILSLLVGILSVPMPFLIHCYHIDGIMSEGLASE